MPPLMTYIRERCPILVSFCSVFFRTSKDADTHFLFNKNIYLHSNDLKNLMCEMIDKGEKKIHEKLKNCCSIKTTTKINEKSRGTDSSTSHGPRDEFFRRRSCSFFFGKRPGRKFNCGARGSTCAAFYFFL